MINSKTFLAAASILAMTIASPAAMADSTRTAADSSVQYNESLKVQMVQDQDGDVDYPNKPTVQINEKMTANGMIGKNAVNQDGEAIATIEDIILSNNGNIEKLVLTDGEWTGMGKMIAIDYDSTSRVTNEGDIVVPMTEASIDNAQSFSYEQNADNMLSVVSIMDGYLLDASDEELADINNISFSNGQADKLIVDIDENLGLTAHNVAIDVDNLRLIQNEDDELHFKLTADQTRSFKNLEESL